MRWPVSGLLLPFLRLAVGIVLLVVRLLASLARSMGGPMMHLILVIAVVLFFAASYLLTFALCRGHAPRHALRPVGVRSRPVPWSEESLRERMKRLSVPGVMAASRPMGPFLGLLADCPSDGSHDFYLSMMLDVPVPRVPMLRARLQDSRRGVPHEA